MRVANDFELYYWNDIKTINMVTVIVISHLLCMPVAPPPTGFTAGELHLFKKNIKELTTQRCSHPVVASMLLLLRMKLLPQASIVSCKFIATLHIQPSKFDDQLAV